MRGTGVTTRHTNNSNPRGTRDMATEQLGDRPTRLVVAEDHPMMGDAIADMVEDSSDFELVGRASTARELIQGFPRWQAEAALVDVELPDASGLEAAKKLLELNPDLVVCFYSGTTDDRIVGEAIKLGARGFLSKQVNPSELLPGLQRAVDGQLAFDRVTASLAVSGMAAAGADGVQLSSRERQVLEMVAQGRTNESIASALSVSSNTVKTILSRARVKLSAPDRASAVNAAIKLGIINPQ